MKRWVFWLLPLLLFLIACSADELAATMPVTDRAAEDEIPPTQVPAETIASATEEPIASPVEPTTVPEPATPTAIPTATTVEETIVVETVEVEASPTIETIVNGQYENTYFRGSETAPVTLIDYSDFL
jgi:hypothetical protein